jgi:lipopolysaccharide/colanic/teichoic acid biosynthesis glycosyltransferase
LDNFNVFDGTLGKSEEKDLIYLSVKRIIDFFGAIFGLAIFSPIFIITAIAIKIDSKGPIIFSQDRVGHKGTIFKMYKFRSMVVNAESLLNEFKSKNEMSEPMFKIKDDPRITRVGRFIRKTSIDELPQLFNVLLGNMSLVGPRPNLPKEVEKFTAYQKQKFEIKPGLTCYWQLMGRNNIDFEGWIQLDIKYMKERNIFIDLKLIYLTIFVLFGDENAR